MTATRHTTMIIVTPHPETILPYPWTCTRAHFMSGVFDAHRTWIDPAGPDGGGVTRLPNGYIIQPGTTIHAWALDEHPDDEFGSARMWVLEDPMTVLQRKAHAGLANLLRHNHGTDHTALLASPIEAYIRTQEKIERKQRGLPPLPY